MAAGLQVFDEKGALMVDLGTRLARFLGSVSSGSHSGATHVPGFSTGTPFYVSILNTPGQLGTVAGPRVWASGTHLHWEFDSALSQSPVTIVYGVF